MDGAGLVSSQLMLAAGSRESLVATLLGGRPGKNERPHNNTGLVPALIMSPGHYNAKRTGSRTQIRQSGTAHPSPQGSPGRSCL